MGVDPPKWWSPAQAVDVVRQLPAKIAFIKNARKKALLLGFENLGNSCEFGLVQSRFGAEPLGLFRWNNVRVEVMVRILADRLAGIGEPDQVELLKYPKSDFMIRDRRWGFLHHTFVYEERDRDEFHKEMCDRLVFLKDKFLADLATARKIFVHSSKDIDVPQSVALADALAAYGPTRLLTVTVAGAPGAPAGKCGDIVRISDTLCIGLLDRVGDQAPKRFRIDYDDWVALCEAAAGVFGAAGALRPAGSSRA